VVAVVSSIQLLEAGGLVVGGAGSVRRGEGHSQESICHQNFLFAVECDGTGPCGTGPDRTSSSAGTDPSLSL